MAKRKRTTSIEASLFEAVIRGDLHYISEFIDDSSSNIHTEDDQTLLHFAVEYGHADIVLFLLTFGADVSKIDKNGMSPLHFAALYGNLDIATILINNDSNIDLLDLDGASPLHMASQNNHLNIVKLLIDNGANIYNEDLERVTPLHIAIYNNNVDMVKFFFSQMDKDFIKKKITLHNIVAKYFYQPKILIAQHWLRKFLTILSLKWVFLIVFLRLKTASINQVACVIAANLQ